jgi:hypothetical protein
VNGRALDIRKRLVSTEQLRPHDDCAGQVIVMPVPGASADMVCSYGGHVTLGLPDGFRVLAREVARVLRLGGFFIARVFVRPDDPVSHAASAADLAAGRGPHRQHTRAQAAIAGCAARPRRQRTGLDAIWRAWKQLPGPPPALAGQRGWSAAERESLASYAGLPIRHCLHTRYCLPHLAQLQSVHNLLFDTVGCHVGNCEQAEQCPTLVWRKRCRQGEPEHRRA